MCTLDRLGAPAFRGASGKDSTVCGIVGLHLSDPSLEPDLGRLLTPMLTAMTSRGPDSAGVAVYTAPVPEGRLRFSLRTTQAGFDWTALAVHLRESPLGPVEINDWGNCATLVGAGDAPAMIAALHAFAPDLAVVGYGRALEVFKDVGTPAQICERHGIGSVQGYQAVGHTRMATESAVTTEHSHPFAPAADLCLVHNGSFSNHATLRRRLEDLGVRCETDNDSEVAARFVAHHLDQGDDLGDALRRVLKDFDGFYTLLVSTRDEFAVVRDPFACKPLVVAETAGYVAVASEYHALAGLPGIDSARVFEPMPEEVHVWSR